MTDVYLFVIDNYVDEQKVEMAIETGNIVMLFFRSHHDEKNTIESEVKRINAFRQKIQNKCVCLHFNNNYHFEEKLLGSLAS